MIFIINDVTNYLNSAPHSACIAIILIYMFLVLNFFMLLTVFDTRFIKTLTDLKNFGSLYPFNVCLLILIFSFAGIPPILGFCIKLFVFFFVTKIYSTLYITILTIFNFFTLYFYIQNLRYIVNNSKNNYFLYKNNFANIDEIVVFILGWLLLVNLTGFIVLADMISLLSLFSI